MYFHESNTLIMVTDGSTGVLAVITSAVVCHRYYTNNMGLEVLFTDSLVMYIPKTILLVVSWFDIVAGEGVERS